MRLTDEEIINIRDEYLPSQGETFDSIAFARAIESAAYERAAKELDAAYSGTGLASTYADKIRALAEREE